MTIFIQKSLKKMLANINYKGIVQVQKDFEFTYGRPRQCVKKFGNYTIVIFQTGRCRVMGCKKPLDETTLPFTIKHLTIQSVTVTSDLKRVIDLYKLAAKMKSMYEPELFPALRCLDYCPLCVNVFSSGKVVILGLKNLEYENFVNGILSNILSNL